MRVPILSCSLLFGLLGIGTGTSFVLNYGLLETKAASTWLQTNLIDKEAGFASIGLGGLSILAGLYYFRSNTPEK